MKHSVILLMLTLGVTSVFAQNKSVFGIKGGANLVNVALDDNLMLSMGRDNKYQPAFHVGLYELFSFNQKLYADVELLYSSKGYRDQQPSFTTAGGSDDFRVNLHYISVPVLVGYRISESFSALLGPEVSYLAAARQRSNGQSGDISSIWDQRLDVGVAIGMNYVISQKLDVGLRYIHGLTNTVSDELQLTNEQGNLIYMNDIKSQNRVFQASLGYRLN